MPKLELASIEFGTDEGARVALVTFHVDGTSGHHPHVKSFTIPVICDQGGDPGALAAEAEQAIHGLFRQLSENAAP